MPACFNLEQHVVVSPRHLPILFLLLLLRLGHLFLFFLSVFTEVHLLRRGPCSWQASLPHIIRALLEVVKLLLEANAEDLLERL